MMYMVVLSSNEYMFNMGTLSSLELGYSHIKMYLFWYLIGMSLRSSLKLPNPAFIKIFLLVILVSSVVLNLTIGLVEGKAYNYLMFVDELVFLFFLIGLNNRWSLMSWLATVLSGSRSAMIAYSMSVPKIRKYVIFLLVPLILFAPLAGILNDSFLSRIAFTNGLSDYSLVHRLLLFKEGISSLRNNFFENDVFWHLRSYDTTTLYIHNFLSFFQVWGGVLGSLVILYITILLAKIYGISETKSVVWYIVIMLLFFRSYNWHILFGFLAYYSYKNENTNIQHAELE